MAALEITSLHVERGQQMRAIVQHDVAQGLSAEAAMDALAAFLGVDGEVVRLAIAIANEADRGLLSTLEGVRDLRNASAFLELR